MGRRRRLPVASLGAEECRWGDDPVQSELCEPLNAVQFCSNLAGVLTGDDDVAIQSSHRGSLHGLRVATATTLHGGR